MTGKKILTILLAIGVGIIGFWIIKAIFVFAVSIIGWVIGAAVISGIAYLAYRKFNHMLSSGKRLT
jgi:hypothetical protein